MSTPPYLAPYIDASGLHLPSYDSALADLVQQVQNIYGQQQYLGNDSALYELLSVIMLKYSDNLLAAQIVYNNRGPRQGIGAALDFICAMNGIARKPASQSSAQLTLTGTPGTEINNGVVQDQNGYLWNLPPLITISTGGTVVATAVCQTFGAISAAIGTINIISTVVAGWTSVTNAAQAVLGRNVETDSQLRARQAISVSLPSRTLFDATLAAVAQVLGVTRSNGIENPTGATDQYGDPPHSITIAAEGGTDIDVATAIYNNRGMGCYMNGSTAVIVTDQLSGIPTTVRFDRPTYRAFTIIAIVHLINGTSATIAAIAAAIVAYLNSLSFGALVSVDAIAAAAMAVNPNLSDPIFTIRSLTLGYTALVTSPTIAAAGTGYAVNDILAILQTGSSGGALVQVTSVGGGGSVTGISLIQNGTGYTTASGLATTETGAGTGTGCTISITVGSAQGTLDIAMLFSDLAEGITGNVTINQE